MLAAGTPITVALDTTVKSNGTGEGDPVALHVVNPVYSTDQPRTLFIAKDAPAMGHVIVSSKRGFAGRRGDLQFQIDYVLDVAGRRVFLTDQCIGGTAVDRGAVSIATTIVVSPLGLLIQGGDKKFGAGSEFTVYVNQLAALATGQVPHRAPSEANALPPVAGNQGAPLASGGSVSR
jgi:hypothetical protein